MHVEVFHSDGNGFGKNVITFGAGMSSLMHIDVTKKDIFILGKGPTNSSDTMLTAEKEYLIYLTVQQKKPCLLLQYNGVNSYIFVDGIEI